MAKAGTYPLERRELIAEAPGLRMQILTLAAGQEVPWHWHSEVTDTFWCMDGPMVIETRAPTARIELQPGQMHAVPARMAHRVTGKEGGRCRFAILQGVGSYDFMPVG
ncbi:cupin domain-containing protein [Roseicella sp. DB1501]|uniref:cupin domain-containing protein n=1 Tax=Roseicella sp. DB1501 TaxID=2730925 RepID=UPI0014920F32|nr:cupin domain-containing protein [Roseicella sp. DB1501]NOG72332.1 cupin domain-containing protein [Roseicella sp. DB1501]